MSYGHSFLSFSIISFSFLHTVHTFILSFNFIIIIMPFFSLSFFIRFLFSHHRATFAYLARFHLFSFRSQTLFFQGHTLYLSRNCLFYYYLFVSTNIYDSFCSSIYFNFFACFVIFISIIRPYFHLYINLFSQNL